jgi:hypothetical protein
MAELTFTRERETKNTIRYAEDVAGEERPIVGNLYVLKSTVAELGDPERIRVTIEAATEARNR